MNQNRYFRLDRRSDVPNEDVEDVIDLGGIFRALWRGKIIIAVATAIALSAGYYQVAYRTAPIYRASATVALDPQQETLVSFDAVVTGMSGDDASVTTEVAVLQSRRLVGKLVEKMSLTEDPEFNPALARAEPESTDERGGLSFGGLTRRISEIFPGMRVGEAASTEQSAPPAPEQVFENTVSAVIGSLSITRQEWSYLITITAATGDPVKSARIANALSEVYIEDQIETKFEKTREATAWLSNRLADLQRDVESSAKALKDYVAGADLISEDVLQSLNLRLKDQRDRLSEMRLAGAALEARLRDLEEARAQDDLARVSALASDPALDRVLPGALSGDETSLRLFGTLAEQVVARLRADLARTQQQRGLLEIAIDRQQAEIDQQSAELVRVEQLQREAEANRVLYEYFLTRLKEASVQEGIQQADARIISPAAVPGGPSNPGKNRTLLFAAVAGLLLGSGFVLLREKLNRRIRTPDELEEVAALPILGQIPKIPGWSRRAILNYLVRKPGSASAEAVRNLRTSLLLTHGAKPPQVIAVTSALPGEGKTTTAFALAQNYSGLGKRVLLVEGDIRRGAFSEVFRSGTSTAGLSDIVAGEATLPEVVIRPDPLNFDVLLGSTSPRNPADILSSAEFRAFVDEARTLYDVVIFDTPPLLLVPDPRVIGQHADAILFTVLWNRTTKDQIRDALQQLTSTGVTVTGFVLSNIDPKGIRKYGPYGLYGPYGKAYRKSYYKS